jgi:hypothetical protein
MMVCLTHLRFDMKNKFWILLCLMSAAFVQHATAQTKTSEGDSAKKAKIEELKKLRRDLFIQKLELTETETEKFFPIYDEYQLKLKEARKEFKKKWKNKKPEELTEEEANLFLADAIALRKTEVDLFSTYSEKLKSAIPVKKIVILPRVEKEVQHELIKKAGGKGPGGKGPDGKKPGKKGKPGSPGGPPPHHGPPPPDDEIEP